MDGFLDWYSRSHTIIIQNKHCGAFGFLFDHSSATGTHISFRRSLFFSSVCCCCCWLLYYSFNLRWPAKQFLLVCTGELLIKTMCGMSACWLRRRRQPVVYYYWYFTINSFIYLVKRAWDADSDISNIHRIIFGPPSTKANMNAHSHHSILRQPTY